MINWNAINRVIRKNIITFITRYHPCAVIESIEQTLGVYKINLLNGNSLTFQADGSFIKNNF